MFQFYLSSIKSKQIAAEEYNTFMFQFYLSSIKSLDLGVGILSLFLFQFYLSSIKSRRFHQIVRHGNCVSILP